MTTKPPIRYTTAFEILSNVLVNDSPDMLGVDQLQPSLRKHIANGRKRGFHLVSVRWPGGQFGLIFCRPGTNMPDPRDVIKAYITACNTPKLFPEGSSSWQPN